MIKPPLTRKQIDELRAKALEKQRLENEELLARQEAIHELAYELHQKVHENEGIEDKPGFDQSLEAATKMVDAKIATLKAAREADQAKAAAAADMKAPAESSEAVVEPSADTADAAQP